jgi:hypothetical protein
MDVGNKMWHLASCELTAYTNPFVLLHVVVTKGGSANGGRHEKMFDFLVSDNNCNQRKELLKGYVTSLYCTRLN